MLFIGDMMHVALLVSTLFSSCIYPSVREGGLSVLDSTSCFMQQGVIWRDIFNDMDFGTDQLSFLMSTNPSGVFYVRPDGTYKQTHYMDNGPDYFQNGLVRVIQDGKYGFMDSLLNIVIIPKWDFAFPFDGISATVCSQCHSFRREGSEYSSIIGGVWFSIDMQGNTVKEIDENQNK